MLIQHNMSAANANRMLKSTALNRSKTMEKLSSGYRINRAADDAAGLAISEKMRGQIRGLNQASRNVEDGISYVQVADGSLVEVHDMLHRIHELSVQAANGIYVSSDREKIDDEVQQLKEEIARIFEDTEFNTKPIWRGEPEEVEKVVGNTSIVAISIAGEAASNTITDANREAFPRSSISVKADDSGISFSWTAYNGNTYTSNTIPWAADPTGLHKYELKDYLDTTAHPELTGINFTYSYDAIKEMTVNDIKNTLNGRTLSAWDNSYEQVKVNAGTNPNIGFSSVIPYSVQLVAKQGFNATDDLFIEGSNKSGSTYSNVTSTDPLEFSFNMRNIGVVNAKLSNAYYYGNDTSEAGRGLWWDWTYYTGGKYRSTYNYSFPADKRGNVDSLKYALSNASAATFDSATRPSDGVVMFSYNLIAETPFTTTDGSSGQTFVGSVDISFSIDHTTTVKDLEDMFNSITGIDINPSSMDHTFTLYNGGDPNAKRIITDITTTEVEYKGRLIIQCGANEGQRLILDYPTMSNRYLGIEGLKVDTQRDAEEAITVAQEAVQKVSKVRSLFGAFQNRLEHTLAYDDNAAENLQAAESRLRDADMAENMVDLSKYNILLQAGQEALSMANSSPERVLELLQQ